MNFDEALEILNITDYKERIINSSTNGELLHLEDYFLMARMWKETNQEGINFRNWFITIVNLADKNWKRPESIFQHILKYLKGEFERQGYSTE